MDGIEDGIKIEKVNYNPKLVENNINLAIQDKSLPFVGGHYTHIIIHFFLHHQSIHENIKNK